MTEAMVKLITELEAILTQHVDCQTECELFFEVEQLITKTKDSNEA